MQSNKSSSRHSLVFLLGPSGSGKTVIARMLAPTLSYDLIDTDQEIISRSEGMAITQIFERFGEDHFRSLEAKVVSDLATRDRKAIVATGGGLPAIPGMMDRLRSIGLTVYLKAEVGTLWARLSARPRELPTRPLLAKGGIERLRELVVAREPTYSLSDIVFRTDTLSVDDVCAALRGILADGSRPNQ